MSIENLMIEGQQPALQKKPIGTTATDLDLDALAVEYLSLVQHIVEVMA